MGEVMRRYWLPAPGNWQHMITAVIPPHKDWREVLRQVRDWREWVDRLQEVQAEKV